MSAESQPRYTIWQTGCVHLAARIPACLSIEAAYDQQEGEADLEA